jgi:hypothetical protein
MINLLVPTTGFEPAHLMAPPPQDGMSTNFTTWALMTATKILFLFKSINNFS